MSHAGPQGKQAVMSQVLRAEVLGISLACMVASWPASAPFPVLSSALRMAYLSYTHPTCQPSASRPPSHSPQCNAVKIWYQSCWVANPTPSGSTDILFLERQWSLLTAPQMPLECLNLPDPPEGTLRLAPCLCFPAQSMHHSSSLSQQSVDRLRQIVPSRLRTIRS